MDSEVLGAISILKDPLLGVIVSAPNVGIILRIWVTLGQDG